jgi:hypothetical protein
MKENVMPNLFRHLIKSNPYETLKQVQGDKKELRHSLRGERIEVREKFLLFEDDAS